MTRPRHTLPALRRRHVLALGAVPWLGACATRSDMSNAERLPIVFAHGNGDNASIWTTTIWRFETNGWPRERLHAFDLTYPLARDDDTREQPGRSSTADHRRALAAEVERVCAQHGTSQVILVGNSRGGNAIRSYLANGGTPRVAAAVLGGVPNHGIYVDANRNPNNEFNGAGPFLTGLNAPQGAQGLEVPAGVRVLTLRSDSQDKYAQPDGVWLGMRGTPTNVTFEGPALRGAENVVLPGADHREVSFGPAAFAASWRFLTGSAPRTTAIEPEPRVVLDGRVSGSGLDNRQGAFASNLPLVGATVTVYAVDAQGARTGAALHERRIGADGRWGPFTTGAGVAHEFVIAAEGYATTHVYRSPFPRSSRVVNLRPERIAAADREGGTLSVVTFTRPRGYFGIPRNRIVFDGASPPAGIPSGVPGHSTVRVKLTDRAMRPIAGEFDGERIAGVAWPLADGHLVVLELTN